MFDLTAKHIVYFFLLLALLLGVALRLHHLGDKGFWGDEIWTARPAERSLGYILAHSGVVPGFWRPPVYLVMAHFALFVGHKEFAVRLPALIFGILGIAMIYRLGRLFYSKAVGLVAAVLLAISPYHLWYSQEARWYSQLVFFSMVSLFFFYRFVLPGDNSRKSSVKNGVGFVLGTVLTLYTHLLAFLILPTQILFAGYVWLSQWLTGKKEGSDRFGHSPLVFFFLRFSLALVVILFFALPLLWPVLSPTSISTSTSSGVRITARFGLQLPDYNSMLRLIGGLLVAYGAGTRVVVYLFFVLFLLGIFFTVYRQRRLAILIILWLTGPFLSTLFWQSKFGILPRYLIFLFPVYLIVVAKGIVLISDWFYQRWTGWRARSHYFFEGHHPAVSQKWQSQQPIIGICLVLITVLFVLQLPIIRLNYLEGKQNDWRGLARYMEQHVQPGDVIVGEAWFQAAFTYYFNRSGDVSIINVLVIEEAMPILKNLIETERRVWAVVIPNTSFKGDEDLRGSTVDFIRDNFSRLVDRKEWEDPDLVYTFPEDVYFTFPISEPVPRIYFHDGSTPAKAEIKFEDITNAAWTTESYKGIAPGESYQGWLALEASTPRQLKLTYFDFPGKDLRVLIDGQVAGEIAGGNSATWKTYTVAIPPASGDEVVFTLENPGHEAFGVSKVWLEYTLE